MLQLVRSLYLQYKLFCQGQQAHRMSLVQGLHYNQWYCHSSPRGSLVKSGGCNTGERCWNTFWLPPDLKFCLSSCFVQSTALPLSWLWLWWKLTYWLYIILTWVSIDLINSIWYVQDSFTKFVVLSSLGLNFCWLVYHCRPINVFIECSSFNLVTINLSCKCCKHKINS